MLDERRSMSAVLRYHDATKHHFTRFAQSLGYLDWATQPDPFRRYDGAPRTELSRRPADPFRYDDLFTPAAAQPDRPSVAPRAVTLERVSWLARYSMGLSAWKQYGRSRWALRVNPSSGNLHPTELYVISRSLDGGEGWGVYHYAPEAHVLERRLETAADPIGCFGVSPADHLVAGISSIHWREAWKYGERAFRYCQHDTGHAIAAVSLAARLLGWDARLAGAPSSRAIASLLGLDRDDDFGESEREEPQCLLVVGPAAHSAAPAGESAGPPQRWRGVANRLSRERVDWAIIDEIAAATRIPPGASGNRDAIAAASVPVIARDADAPRLILQRRSAVAFDGASFIDRDTFVRMLARVMPAPAPPWSALWWAPRVHLALFVHRVEGMDPGLYLLVRNPASEALVRSELQRDFLWARVPGVPDALPLFCLARGDCRRLAARLSCDQEIASAGCFSLGMIAELEPAIEARGLWFYRHLFWESGVVGQVLYLEAEAAGVRATGIGCFYDEPVHDTLGIFSHRLQSLYHFTVGMPVEDTRLTTEPGYAWERS